MECKRLGLIRMCFTNHGHSCRTSHGVDARVVRIKKKTRNDVSVRTETFTDYQISGRSREKQSRSFPGHSCTHRPKSFDSLSSFCECNLHPEVKRDLAQISKIA